MSPIPKITNTFSYILSHVSEFLFPSPNLPHEFADLPPALMDSLPPRTDALFAYRDEQVKLLVWEIKYHKNERAADDVGKLLAERIVKSMSGEHIFLVPIPLTARRLRERGFNHTEMIARSTLKFLPAQFSLELGVLTKIRHTEKQASLTDRAERLQNMTGAFALAPSVSASQIAGKTFIIIDDVVTTGATITSARRALEDAGGKTHVFCIAH